MFHVKSTLVFIAGNISKEIPCCAVKTTALNCFILFEIFIRERQTSLPSTVTDVNHRILELYWYIGLGDITEQYNHLHAVHVHPGTRLYKTSAVIWATTVFHDLIIGLICLFFCCCLTP